MIEKRHFQVTCMALLLLSCTRQDEAPVIADGKDIEMRGPDGHILLKAIVNTREGHWVSSQGEGRFKIGEGAIDGTAGMHAGWSCKANLTRDGLVMADVDGARLYVTRVDGLLRIGDGSGFPLARIRREGAGAVMHDAAGMLAARATAEGGRMVISDRDDHILGYVIGLDDPERAVTLFVKGLGDSERALLLAPDLFWP